MKVTFVESPAPWLVRQHVQVPLGPLYLCTMLKKAGCDVRLFRPNTVEELSDVIGSNVVAFSGTTLESAMVEECAKFIRQNSPNSVIWYGGPHATAMVHELVQSPLFDAIGVGEGESYVVHMLEDTQARVLKKIYFPLTLMELDTIPHPDRTIIEGNHGGDIFSFGENYTGTGNENVATARGCPYNCAFCASRSMWRGQVRLRSASDVLDEIRKIVEDTHTKQIRFCDDHFAANRKRAIRLCNGLQEIGVSWRCSIRADILTQKLCKAMYKGGCKEISPGIESGDQRVLDFLNKNTKLKNVKKGCKIATDAGIHVRGLFMIGTPGELPDTPEINLNFIQNLDCFSFTLSTYIPLPGTDIWLNPDKFNCQILTKDFQKYNKDFWVSKCGEAVKREYTPLIHNKFLTLEQQKDNTERMEKYILETERCNKG